MVDAENATMVDFAIESNNRSAHAKHVKIYKEKKRLEALAELDGMNAEQLDKLQGATKRRQTPQQQHRQDEQRHRQESESSSDDEDSESSTEVLDTARSMYTAADGTEEDYSQIKVCSESSTFSDVVECSSCFTTLCRYRKRTFSRP